MTRANWPGHSRRSGLSNVAFSLIVSVVMSTALSTKVSVPVDGCAVGVLRRRGDRQLAAGHVRLIVAEVDRRHREGDVAPAARCAIVISSVWFAVTRLPAFTARLPVRPSIGDLIAV